MSRPNLVFVFADQLRYQSCGFAGDAFARTPNLDRLAAQSVSFTNAVSNTPVCAAYRASLFTGKYTTSTGMVINEIRLNPDHHPHPLARCLAELGMEPAYIGKWHLWANQLGNHFDPKNSFVPPGPHRLGFDGLFAHYNFHHDYYGPNAYYHLDSPQKIWYGGGVYEPDAQTDMAIDFIRHRGGLSAGRVGDGRAGDGSAGDGGAGVPRPFALFLSYGPPHDPWDEWNVPPEELAHFAGVDLPLSPTYSTTKDPHGDAWSNHDHNPESVRRHMRIYHAMTESVDRNVGRLLAALEEEGLLDDTLVVFTSDHGEMFGAHGRLRKNSFYDEAARVPLLLRFPGRIAPGTRDMPLSTVDLMPTMLGLLGGAIPEEVEGADVSAALFGSGGPAASPGGEGGEAAVPLDAGVPRFAFMQNTGAVALWEDGHEWRAVRDRRYTYAIYRSDRQELLFDNIDDPAQARNLAGEPAHARTLDHYRAALAGVMERLGDRFDASTWYRDHWVDAERRIVRSARAG